MKKKTAVVLAAALATALVSAAPASASEPGPPGAGPQDLGLESIAVASAALQDPRTGEVRVSGTVTCSAPLRVLLHSSVRQDSGRSPRLVEASGGASVLCDGETPFAFAVSPDRGRLRVGNATVFAAAFAGDPLTSFDAVEVGPVEARLAPSR